MSIRFSFSYFCCCCFFVGSLFHLCLSNENFDDDVLCMRSERQALLRFKQGLVDETNRLASWDAMVESDCCKWVGIGCNNSTGHVHRVHLPNQKLSGILSSSLLHLKKLRHLDLSCNDFGEIQVPEFIGSLRNLRYLNLSVSHFYGVVPPQLGNLSELQVLCLGSFYRKVETTSMMNMQWLSTLRSLQHLDMSGLSLIEATDWLQVMNTLPSLVELHLSSCQLSYINIHVSSLNLTSLSVLDLSSNYFNSSVAPWIFSLTSLVSLDLSDCTFHGPTPKSIHSFRNLTSLKFLHFSWNKFMNSSSVLKGLSSVGGSLISLDISFCDVSSSALDSLHNMTSLVSLDLSYNQLTKAIPKSLGNLCNLRDLDLSRNNFSSISLTNLVENVFKCKSPALESISLRYSELSGDLPVQLGQLINLKYVDLSGNRISGNIPDSVGRLTFLRSLDLSVNLISGPIPSSIGRLSFLKKLDLSQNRLNGSLPYLIGQLSLLKELDLSENQLNGSLPNSLGQLSKLEALKFSSNLLTGVVTEAHFSKLVSLKRLEGEGNNLTLTLQLVNWIPPFQLGSLNLNSWGLGPKFPLWLQSQKGLYLLDISNTGISSPMPPGSFWSSLPNLEYLDMSQNHIKGTLSSIPATTNTLDLSFNEFTGILPDLSNISLPGVIDLSNNFFTGSLHNFCCPSDVKETMNLYLGDNHLSGVIPECWEKWPLLLFLNLKNNNLSGRIPTTLGSLSNLYSLNLHGNKLSGRLPASLMNLTDLDTLQLGRNELIGNIPSWFGTKLSSLRILNLRSNNFHGNIPLELCYLTTIQILYLADNNLSGNIPRCFNNFTVLSGKETKPDDQFITYYAEITENIIISDSLVMKGREYTYSTILRLVMMLDLSNNNFSGSIPSELTALVKLQTLNLSRNQLTGSIPEKIGDMKELISFDSSVNMLSGELPMSLSSLNRLSNFNVSYNNFTGRVPSSTQLQSFNESSFFGNKLCGDPLTDPCVRVEIPKTDTEDKQEDGEENFGLIISIVLGFISGFWIVFLPLIVSTSWRISYYRFMSKLGYMVYNLIHKYCFYVFSK